MLGTFLKAAAVTVATGAGVLLGVSLGSDGYEYVREKAVGPRKQMRAEVEVKETKAKSKPKAKAQARRPKPSVKPTAKSAKAKAAA